MPLVLPETVCDTPTKMKAHMELVKLDEKQSTMLTGDENDVRVLSNLFNVRYRAMSKDDLAHSNMLTLLNAQGVVKYKSKGPNQDKSMIGSLLGGNGIWCSHFLIKSSFVIS